MGQNNPGSSNIGNKNNSQGYERAIIRFISLTLLNFNLARILYENIGTFALKPPSPQPTQPSPQNHPTSFNNNLCKV